MKIILFWLFLNNFVVNANGFINNFFNKKNIFIKHKILESPDKKYRNNYYEQMLKNLNSKNMTERDNAILSEGLEEINNNNYNNNNENIFNVTELYKRKILSLKGLGLEIEIVEQGLPMLNDSPKNDDESDFDNEFSSPKYGYGPQGKNGNKDSDNVDEFEIIRNSSFSFKNIGGYDLVKSELKQCIDILKNYKKYKKYSVRAPKGLILEGPPGTGKTLFAKALAGESNCTFIAVSGSDFARKYVGEGSARIKKLFSLAKKNIPAIIFIDELDSIGRTRSGDSESASAERDNTLNSLLVELDGFKNLNGIFVVAATNRLDIIDSALLRPGRIDKKIKIDLPDYDARKTIIQIHIKGKPYDSTINLHDLTEMLEGLTGAQIENVLNEAMLLALRNNMDFFNLQDVNFVYDRMYVGWQPLNHEFNEDLINRIAVHEMGHAVVGILSQYHSKLNKVVINLSSPNSPGYTIFKPNKNKLYFKEALFEHLMILLAGRIAEEEIFGLSITTGASNDLREVNKLATEMIEIYGMGTHIIYPSFSEKYRNLKDDDIIKLIEYAQHICKEIISECRDLIIYTSKILIKNNNISSDELEFIISTKFSKILKIRESNKKIDLYNNIENKSHRFSLD